MAKKQPIIDLPIDLQADWIQALELQPLPPRRRDDGSANPAYYQEALNQLNILNRASLMRGEPLKGYDSYLKGLMSEAEFAGFDPKTIGDARSDADKHRDAVDKILENPNEFFTLIDDDLRVMQEQMQSVLEKTQKIIDDREMDSISQAAQEARLARGKAMLNRINLAIRLRELARTPYNEKWHDAAA